MDRDYDAVMFDLDGTLVTTEYEHRDILVGRVMAELGRKKPSMDRINAFWFGADRDGVIREQLGIDDPAVFWAAFNMHDTLELREQYTRPYDDVGELVRLQEEGYRMSIVTGAPPKHADMEIGLLERELGISRDVLFDHVLVARMKDSGIAPKPAPDGILKSLDLLGVEPRRSIYVGNADEDVMAANAAGVVPVVVERGEFRYDNSAMLVSILDLYQLRSFMRM